MKLLPRLVFCMSVIWLASCSTQPNYEPNVIVDESEPVSDVIENTTDIDRGNMYIEQEKQIEAEKAITDSTDSAVQSLTEQARLKYRRGDLTRAIALAERALRINRRSPEPYLILAQCYWQKILPQQARQFAQKGLRYSERDSEAYIRLTDMLERM